MGLKMKYSHENYNVCQFVLCSVRFYFSKKVKVVALQLFSKFTQFWISTPKDRFKIKTWKTKILLTWVLNATNAIIQQQQSKHWKFTFAPTVERNHISVTNAIIQQQRSKHWKITFADTPERNRTSAHNAIIQPLKMHLWQRISSPIVERNYTNVHNVKSPLAKLEV